MLLQDGMVIVAGVYMDRGCEAWREGEEWNSPGPFLGPPPGLLVAAGSERLLEGPWLEETWGPVAFAFPMSLGSNRWGVAWGQAIEGTAFERGSMGGEGWPMWVPSRLWFSELSDGRWLDPLLLDTAPMSFRTPEAARHLTLTDDGSAVLLADELAPGGLQGSSPRVRIWSARHGTTLIPFESGNLPRGGSPVLAVDSRGSHWVAWLEEREGAGMPEHVFMIQEVGPGGTDVRAPREVPVPVQNGARINNMTLVIDALDRPHLLWMDGLVVSRFSHAAAVGEDGEWVSFAVEGPDEGERSGVTMEFVAGADSQGGLSVFEGTSNLAAHDGTFGNVNLWTWTEDGWEFLGVDEGPGRADLDLLPVLRSRGSSSPASPGAVWTSVVWPSSTDGSPPVVPERFLRLLLPDR